MNRCSKRTSKKKAVPLYFQRSHSSSQFLLTAKYKHEIKKLKKVNKELATSVQELKCRAADQEKALAEVNREATLKMFVKMKVKNIVETVQNLVADLGEVYDVIGGHSSFDFLKNCSTSHQEARLRIRNPSISVIEESASMSTLEPDLSKEASPSLESSTETAGIRLPTTTSPLLDADASQTEIYNVPVALTQQRKSRSSSSGKQGMVTRSSKSLGRTTRSSKSLERTGSLSLNQASPSTPQTPVFIPITFPIKSYSLEGISKRKSFISEELQKKDSPSKVQLMPPPAATKNTAKLTSSKIPVKKPISSENKSLHVTSPSNDVNRRKTFLVKQFKKSCASLDSEQSGAFVLDALAGNANSNAFCDRRGTFVLEAPPNNAKPDIISERRGTYVLNPVADTDKSDSLDRRLTYFVPTQSKEQPNSSPPKTVETHVPVQTVVPNETILLCEDMELTEIIPRLNQTQQFIPSLPSWIVQPQREEPGFSENMPSVENQFLCPTLPVTNNNSSKQFEVNTIQAVTKSAQIQNITDGIKNDAQIQNTMDRKMNGVKELEVNALHSVAKSAQIHNTVNEKNNCERSPAYNQAEKSSDSPEKSPHLTNKERKAHSKCPAKQLPSPISHIAKTDLSTQQKSLKSITNINTDLEKVKQTLDSGFTAEGNNRKKSAVSKDSLSSHQSAANKLSVPECVQSPEAKRRSARKKSVSFNKFFSDSSESDLDIDMDFMPEKRFSLKPGRKIINPNNKKRFVFKKNITKPITAANIQNDINPDKSPCDDIKDNAEIDLFNFSTSSEASKSPLKKQKKRKSVVVKTNKRSAHRKSIVDDKTLPKRQSKKSCKAEMNQDEVTVASKPRKSILCLNKDNGSALLTQASQSNRKSVRFTLGGNAPQSEINNPCLDLPLQSNEESAAFTSVGNALQNEISNQNYGSTDRVNATPVAQKCNDIHDTKKEASENHQSKILSAKEKNSSTQSYSLKVTESVVTHTNAKLKKSRKRQSNNLNLDSPEDVCESDCSPRKKINKVPNETSQKMEAYTNLNCERQSEDAKDKYELSKEDRSNKVSSEVLKEKTVDATKGKKSGRILSELPLNLDANVKVSRSTGKKRTFSGVSERRSSKKDSIVDDIFLDLDNEIPKISDKNIKAPLLLVEEPVKEIAKSAETDCIKRNSVKSKTPKQKKDKIKKGSSQNKKAGSVLSKDKENTPKKAENLKFDILTSDSNLFDKESVGKIVKPKSFKKKKELTPSPLCDLKADVLCSDDAIESRGAVGGRPRRSKPVCLKEPKLNSKMRRE